jgi:hypothetical protein
MAAPAWAPSTRWPRLRALEMESWRCSGAPRAQARATATARTRAGGEEETATVTVAETASAVSVTETAAGTATVSAVTVTGVETETAAIGTGARGGVQTGTRAGATGTGAETVETTVATRSAGAISPSGSLRPREAPSLPRAGARRLLPHPLLRPLPAVRAVAQRGAALPEHSLSSNGGPPVCCHARQAALQASTTEGDWPNGRWID